MHTYVYEGKTISLATLISIKGIVNLDFVIIIVTCYIPETNETNFQKNTRNDFEKNCDCGYGGSASNIYNVFQAEKIYYLLKFYSFFLQKVKHIIMLYKTTNKLILLKTAFLNEKNP